MSEDEKSSSTGTEEQPLRGKHKSTRSSSSDSSQESAHHDLKTPKKIFLEPEDLEAIEKQKKERKDQPKQKQSDHTELEEDKKKKKAPKNKKYDDNDDDQPTPSPKTVGFEEETQPDPSHLNTSHSKHPSSISKSQSQVLDVDKVLKGRALNPFVNRTINPSFWQWLKYLFMGLSGIFLLRLMLLGFFFFNAVIWAKISTIGISKAQSQGKEPMGPARLRIQWISRFMARCMLFACGYYWIPEHGKREGDRNKAKLIAPNHRSWTDAVFLFWAYGPSFVAKAELGEAPVLGSMTEAFQVILVKRDKSDAKKNVLDSIIERAQSPQAFPQILIFPEGTTTNGSCLITYKVGAFAAMEPVQPVYLQYDDAHFDNSWVPVGPSVFKLFFRTLCQFVNYMEVHYLPVESPLPDENPTQFADRVRDAVGVYSRLPVTNHSFEDMVLMGSIAAAHLPASTLDVDFQSLQKIYEMDLRDAKNLLKKFAKADRDRNGTIDRSEFAKLIGLPDSGYTHVLFDTFDTNGDGQIEFKEFVVGLASISKNFPASEAIQLGFETFNSDKSGAIDQESFGRLLQQCFKDITPPEINELFQAIDTDRNGKIDHEEFSHYCLKHPEFNHLVRHISWALKRKTSLGNSTILRTLRETDSFQETEIPQDVDIPMPEGNTKDESKNQSQEGETSSSHEI